MFLEEILPEIRKGRKFRRKCWDKSQYRVANDLKIFDRYGGYLTTFNFSCNEVFADDWELVPEKRKFSHEIYLWSDGEVTTIKTRYSFLNNSHHLLPETNIVETRTIEWEVEE